jgi:hypothetical protein
MAEQRPPDGQSQPLPRRINRGIRWPLQNEKRFEELRQRVRRIGQPEMP